MQGLRLFWNRLRLAMAGLLFLSEFVVLGAVIMPLAGMKSLIEWVFGWPASARFFPRAPAWWAGFATWTTHNLLIGTRIRMETPMPVINKDERVLLLVNHPTTPETILAYHCNTWRYTRYFAAVMTQGLRWLPVGAVFYLAGGALFIRRRKKQGDRSDAREVMRSQVFNYWRPGTTFAIHIDQGRPKASSIAKDCARHGTDFTHIRMCKTGGLGEILGLVDLYRLPVRVLSVTAGFGVRANGLGTWDQIVDRTYHIHVREVPLSELPRDEAALQTWGKEDCARKDALLKEWSAQNN